VSEAKETKHAKYEETAKRKQVLSIRTSKGDDTAEWDTIVTWLKDQGDDGTAKDGLYKLAKKSGVI